MKEILTLEKCISIDGTLIPKNTREISITSNGVIVGNVSTTENIVLKINECKIDGVVCSSLPILIEYLALQLFTDGGVTREWVIEQILNAQLEGEEVDLSVFLLRNEWQPYQNQFAHIADSIRELGDIKANKTDLINDYVSNAQLTAKNYALKSELFNSSVIADLLGLKIYTTTVNAVSGDWSVTFPNGKFTSPPFVIPIALNDDKTSKNRANFASLDRGTTTTLAKGVAKSCVTVGLGGSEMTNTDCPVNIIAIGL